MEKPTDMNDAPPQYEAPEAWAWAAGFKAAVLKIKEIDNTAVDQDHLDALIRKFLDKEHE
jgi:hypothetical protein